jgi:hypothetical protein
MAETTITEQIVREAPEIEAYKLGLYQDAQKYIRDLQAQGIQPPAQGIAGFTSEQLAAGDVIRSGIGGYEPYLGGALSANQAAQQMIAQGSAPLLQESLAQQQAGISGLEQARQLALAQRQAPFQLRDQALRGFLALQRISHEPEPVLATKCLHAQQGLGRAGSTRPASGSTSFARVSARTARGAPFRTASRANWRVKACAALDKRNVASRVKSVVRNRRNNWQRSVLDSPRGRLKGS